MRQVEKIEGIDSNLIKITVLSENCLTALVKKQRLLEWILRSNIQL